MGASLNKPEHSIGAVILAAGLSQRMGRPKMVLPWGEGTVIGQVVGQLSEAGVEEICVVTGGARREVEDALRGYPVRLAFNPHYEDGEMLHSLQVGLRNMPPRCSVALMVLGDQPQIRSEVVRAVIQAYEEGEAPLVIPSYQMRRGHPWLIDRDLWGDIFALQSPATLRDFIGRHADQICYVNLDEPSILSDMDTPEDYQSQRPNEKI